MVQHVGAYIPATALVPGITAGSGLPDRVFIRNLTERAVIAAAEQ